MSKVLWNQAALDELAKLWIYSIPSDVTQAISTFQEQFTYLEAHEVGESRRNLSERLCIIDPLRFLFTVEFQDGECVVMVQHVWSTFC